FGRLPSKCRAVPVAALVVVVLTFPAAIPAADYDATPILHVGGDTHLLAQGVDLDVDAMHLDQAGAPQRLVVSTPAGYGVNLAHPAGTELGFGFMSTVSAAGGAESIYFGLLAVMDPAAYAASVGAQACAPGVHAAVWTLHVATLDQSVAFDMPIAVDPTPGGGYTMAMCFDDERA